MHGQVWVETEDPNPSSNVAHNLSVRDLELILDSLMVSIFYFLIFYFKNGVAQIILSGELCPLFTLHL